MSSIMFYYEDLSTKSVRYRYILYVMEQSIQHTKKYIPLKQEMCQCHTHAEITTYTQLRTAAYKKTT